MIRPNFLVYTTFFWLTWLLILPLVLKVVADEWALIYIFVYSLVGLAAYFTLPRVFEKCMDNIESDKYQGRKTIEQNKEMFFEEQRLRKKYRYIKLNKKENIINSDIDRSDKILLLEIIHGCSREEISRLLQKNNP